MNNNTARYRVDIPAYIVVYMDNDLRPVSHDIDIDQAIMYPNDNTPTVIDFRDKNGEMPKVFTDIRESLDEYNNALNYARGLLLISARQIVQASSPYELMDNGEPF